MKYSGLASIFVSLLVIGLLLWLNGFLGVYVRGFLNGILGKEAKQLSGVIGGEKSRSIAVRS